MTIYSSLTLLLILSGALIMLVNLVKFDATVRLVDQIEQYPTAQLRKFLQTHKGLMLFFILGYLIVASGLGMGKSIINDLFVGLIFFFGAIFVLMGVILQSKLIQLLNQRYAREHLDKEKLKLENLERQQAEAALQASEAQLQAILNSLPIGVAIIDADTKGIQDINDFAVKAIGIPKEQVIGLPCHRFICPSAKNSCPMDQSEVSILEDENTLLTAAGVEIPIYKTACCIELNDKKHYLETFIDLSDRKRLEEQLQRSEKMEILGKLAGGVAHDLNNILSALVGYPELLLKRIDRSSDLRAPLETIRQSGEKAAVIVQDLLTLARRGVTSPTSISLNNVVQEFMQSPECKKILTDNAGTSISTRLDERLARISGSHVHLCTTVMNLVANAAEAMPHGGEIVLSTTTTHLDTPMRGYSTINQGTYAVLTIQDEGVGITTADAEYIFEPFFTTKAMGRSGTGLGMSIVWGTVKDHSGYIDVQSTVGSGSTFSLYFPVCQLEPPAVAQEQADLDLRGNGETVLVVDDIRLQREIAEAMLHDLGYQVTSVASGEEAIAHIEARPVDILLLDMIMAPGIDGLETYRRILAGNNQQKAIISSGYSKTKQVAEVMKAEACGYLQKPYTCQELGAAIHQVLDSSAP